MSISIRLRSLKASVLCFLAFPRSPPCALIRRGGANYRLAAGGSDLVESSQFVQLYRRSAGAPLSSDFRATSDHESSDPPPGATKRVRCAYEKFLSSPPLDGTGFAHLQSLQPSALCMPSTFTLLQSPHWYVQFLPWLLLQYFFIYV